LKCPNCGCELEIIRAEASKPEGIETREQADDPWTKLPATPNQIAWLKARKIDATTMSKREASDEIDLIMKKGG